MSNTRIVIAQGVSRLGHYIWLIQSIMCRRRGFDLPDSLVARLRQDLAAKPKAQRKIGTAAALLLECNGIVLGLVHEVALIEPRQQHGRNPPSPAHVAGTKSLPVAVAFAYGHMRWP